MHAFDERAGRVDQAFARSRKSPPLAVADAVSRDQHVLGCRQRVAVSLGRHAKAARTQLDEHRLVVDQLSMNRGIPRIGQAGRRRQHIANAKAKSHCIGT